MRDSVEPSVCQFRDRVGSQMFLYQYSPKLEQRIRGLAIGISSLLRASKLSIAYSSILDIIPQRHGNPVALLHA